MPSQELQKIAKKQKYSEELIKYLGKISCGWNFDEIKDSLITGKTEREILEISFRPWNEGPLSEDKMEMYKKECIEEGKHEYLSHCNPDGTFRFEDFI